MSSKGEEKDSDVNSLIPGSCHIQIPRNNVFTFKAIYIFFYKYLFPFRFLESTATSS